MRLLPRGAKRSNVRHSDRSKNGSSSGHTLTNQCFWKATCFGGKSFPKPARVGVDSLLLGQLIPTPLCPQQAQEKLFYGASLIFISHLSQLLPQSWLSLKQLAGTPLLSTSPQPASESHTITSESSWLFPMEINHAEPQAGEALLFCFHFPPVWVRSRECSF